MTFTEQIEALTDGAAIWLKRTAKSANERIIKGSKAKILSIINQ